MAHQQIEATAKHITDSLHVDIRRVYEDENYIGFVISGKVITSEQLGMLMMSTDFAGVSHSFWGHSLLYKS